MPQSHCQICKQQQWLDLNTLIGGIWNTSAIELEREVLSFTISKCKNCHHVQISTPYTTEIFNALYFSNTGEPDMWCNTPIGSKSPYEEMVEFFEHYITPNANIIDFGSGAGLTLKQIENNFPHIKLTLNSVDFHNNVKSSTIKHISADLNNLTDISQSFNNSPIDLAISTHVLEHVLSPIDFLLSIKNNLDDNGAIFIEVPDSGENASKLNLEFTNLIHGQHIHYYSLESLKKIVFEAGLKVVKYKHLITGNIPRLMVILKKLSPQNILKHSIEKYSITETIDLRFYQYNNYLSNIKNKISTLLGTENKVGLWGIGGDFYLLMKAYPDLLEAIYQEKIVLYDKTLAGHTFKGKKIKPSSELENNNIIIFIVPIYGPTREKMNVISKYWQVNIIDIYSLI